jgi:hypothetical protein
MENEALLGTRMKSLASSQEVEAYVKLRNLFENSPIPPNEILSNLGLYLTRPSLSRIFFMREIYLKALEVHGVVMELGTRWGQNASLFSSFRTMYEPFNFSRKIIAFDTFEGFPEVSIEDGSSDEVKAGAYAISADYEFYLEKILEAQEQLAPRPNLKKFELIKGDVSKTLPEYLAAHPETIVSLVYFDMDIYPPTKAALQALRPHLTKGSVIGFDELCLQNFPGETVALREVLGLDKVAMRRDPNSNWWSYCVVE